MAAVSIPLEHLWPIYAPSAFFASIGLGMMRLNEFRKARIFFWIAAILLVILAGFSQLVTPAPFWVRSLSGLLSAMFVFVVFPETLGWLSRWEKSSPAGK